MGEKPFVIANVPFYPLNDYNNEEVFFTRRLNTRWIIIKYAVDNNIDNHPVIPRERIRNTLRERANELRGQK